jgi:hypothetical protein
MRGNEEILYSGPGIVRRFDLKILVIENNVEISEALSFFCGAKKDIECEVVNTGQEGLDRIRQRNLILSC